MQSLIRWSLGIAILGLSALALVGAIATYGHQHAQSAYGIRHEGKPPKPEKGYTCPRGGFELLDIETARACGPGGGTAVPAAVARH
ncbi:hypothetical protein FCH28_36850 [Streptomyces piniterrae]|uniref:Uncharacterized protein n=1 Tax=Streptomyces piniterrae TaxID=2571125 RepID=A0A4U0MLR9_9ACTN|nr:hypothetical protein [Streptomyces piniterrae]TJZ41412.1 hypothetical protein FCH28_36850 [Streptomyces piniterrae]